MLLLPVLLLPKFSDPVLPLPMLPLASALHAAAPLGMHSTPTSTEQVASLQCSEPARLIASAVRPKLFLGAALMLPDAMKPLDLQGCGCGRVGVGGWV